MGYFIVYLPQPPKDTAASDPLYEEAVEVVREFRKASANFLQMELRIGYARAARLLDILENEGVIGPAEGNAPRQVVDAS